MWLRRWNDPVDRVVEISGVWILGFLAIAVPLLVAIVGGLASAWIVAFGGHAHNFWDGWMAITRHHVTKENGVTVHTTTGTMGPFIPWYEFAVANLLIIYLMTEGVFWAIRSLRRGVAVR